MEKVAGYLRIIEPVDPLESRRRIVLVDDKGAVIRELKPTDRLLVEVVNE